MSMSMSTCPHATCPHVHVHVHMSKIHPIFNWWLICFTQWQILVGRKNDVTRQKLSSCSSKQILLTLNKSGVWITSDLWVVRQLWSQNLLCYLFACFQDGVLSFKFHTETNQKIYLYPRDDIFRCSQSFCYKKFTLEPKWCGITDNKVSCWTPGITHVWGFVIDFYQGQKIIPCMHKLFIINFVFEICVSKFLYFWGPDIKRMNECHRGGGSRSRVLTACCVGVGVGVDLKKFMNILMD